MKFHKLVITGLLLLMFGVIAPLTVMAQQDAQMTPPIYDFDDDGNAYVTFDLQIDGIPGGEAYLGLWAVFADSLTFIPNQNGDELFTDQSGDFVSDIVLQVDYQSSIWEGENAITLIIPGDAFPLGNYDWFPYVGIFNTEDGSSIAEYTFNDPEFYVNYSTDFADMGTDPEANGVYFDKIHYTYDEFININFDLTLVDFPVGSEVAVSAYALYFETDEYVPSTNAYPGYTDSQGDVYGATIFTVVDDEATVWLLADDNQGVVQMPIGNFPAGEYLVYPQLFVMIPDGNGGYAPIHEVNLTPRTIFISG